MLESICLTTITDDAFLPGTQALISSFLAHNSWFDGDVVIIHDGVSDAVQAGLSPFQNVRYHHVSEKLRARLMTLTGARPDTAPKLANFFSCESFMLPYTAVLYLDSDMLCLGGVGELLGTHGGLVCCPDQAYFGGRVRRRDTYVPLQPDQAAGHAVFDRTFNTGMMLIRPGLLGPDAYERVLNRITPEKWPGVKTGHTDSVILNIEFEHEWVAASERYNYLVSDRSARYTRTRSALEDAVFLHYLGRPKPWHGYDRESLDPERKKAFDLWHDHAARISERA